MNKLIIGMCALLSCYGFFLNADLTIHNGTPYPIKVKVFVVGKDRLVEVPGFTEKKIMNKVPQRGLCITGYKVWIKEGGMDEYAEMPDWSKRKLSECGFNKDLMVTAVMIPDIGNYEYKFHYSK